MRKFFYLILVAVCCESCLAQAPSSTIEELNQRVQEVFNNTELPGFSVVVVDDNKVLYQHSLGLSNIATGKAYTGNTIQNIASVSKTFLGVALMIAQEQGQLNLDDEINSHLPFKVVNPHEPNTPITIRHLATHTAGINDEPVYQRAYVLEHPSIETSGFSRKLRKYVDKMKQNERVDDSVFLRNTLWKNGTWYTRENFIKTTPGTVYHYSNIGASLAAFVIENAVGMSYEDFTRRYIFEPLEMNNSGWDETDVDIENHATRYLDSSTPIPNYHLITRADGALITNTTDFGKYLIEMLKGYHSKGKLLKPTSYTEMFTRMEFGNESSGIFWGVSKSGNPNHSGADPGVVTIVSVNPNKKLAIFFMSNYDIENNRRTFKSIIKILNHIKYHQWKD